ncbi:SDR family oxidoreductase [Flavivirga spongiicola]|uniref:SDR family oxidoreductase n=1 Tax=Flavivirga spongiicola TaxID=421621 RepID=A0ABU7XTG0_9FLAO|nr:SDR family oxidoreductase [Flavivirga sp. MEBiC05379]MDO5978852.1 SDR family oxidoreductase [Flavivirga sp. MEBiC05379]
MKTIIITGGTGLIGKELTLYLLKEGYNVVISSRGTNKEEFISANQLQEYEGNLEVLELDYFKNSSINSFVEGLVRLNICPDSIIHNARSLDTLKIEENGQSSVENLLSEFRMGIVGPYELNNSILNSSIGNKLKNIIVISSIYGIVGPTPSLYKDFKRQSPIQYGITKAAQIHLTKELAVRLADRGIRVNAISYGGVEGRADEKFKERYSKFTPLKRMLNTKEVIKPVGFLLSDGASGMTGHNLIVDGGWTIW